MQILLFKLGYVLIGCLNPKLCATRWCAEDCWQKINYTCRKLLPIFDKLERDINQPINCDCIFHIYSYIRKNEAKNVKNLCALDSWVFDSTCITAQYQMKIRTNREALWRCKVFDCSQLKILYIDIGYDYLDSNSYINASTFGLFIFFLRLNQQQDVTKHDRLWWYENFQFVNRKYICSSPNNNPIKLLYC